MQIGIDLGATKIESVVLSDDGIENLRERVPSPKNYDQTLNTITSIVKKIEAKFEKKINVGVCHPGSINTKGLVFNSNNFSIFIIVPNKCATTIITVLSETDLNILL